MVFSQPRKLTAFVRVFANDGTSSASGWFSATCLSVEEFQEIAAASVAELYGADATYKLFSLSWSPGLNPWEDRA